ncbi:hypothetical protein BV898_12302 [Hypsibius exemplaris]|uniref:Uncharacterized protein n=1 Tax=Hypsibius exemplaris TaxID=2072580 RepID=A0A1W0WE24_HYPEX|nr:hypothetical protein BV898_12302 [Hypsibius exemplaris]
MSRIEKYGMLKRKFLAAERERCPEETHQRDLPSPLRQDPTRWKKQRRSPCPQPPPRCIPSSASIEISKRGIVETIPNPESVFPNHKRDGVSSDSSDDVSAVDKFARLAELGGEAGEIIAQLDDLLASVEETIRESREADGEFLKRAINSKASPGRGVEPHRFFPIDVEEAEEEAKNRTIYNG